MMEESEFPNDEEISKHQESFGDFLKRHREASGKSLEDIANVTKISIHYLRAFEENDSSRFPAPAFTRGFLRGYAAEIGLDADICMERFDQFQLSLMPTQVKDVKREADSNILLNQSNALSPNLIVGFVLLVLIVGGGVYWLTRTEAPSGDEFEFSQEGVMEETLPEDPAAGLEEGEARLGDSPEETAAAKPSPAEAKVAPAPAVKPSNPSVPVTPSLLEITALRSSRLRVRLDDNPAERVELASGETKSFYVFKEVEIREVKRGDFSFQYNGRPLEVAGSMIKLFNRHLFKKKSR